MSLRKDSAPRVLFFALLLIWFFSHLPFLSADADIHIRTGGSRGSWSDEGLYTSQIRNYVNQESFDLLESDAFLKTPFLSAYLFTPFSIFGTSMEVGRLATLMFLVASLLVLARYQRMFGIASMVLLTTLMFFPIHQYSHIAMAEIYGAILLLISCLFFSSYIQSNQRRHLLYTFFSLLCASLFKIQFIYALAIPTLSIFLVSLTKDKTKFRKKGIESLIILAAITLGLLFFWYLPFRNEWTSILSQQSNIFERTTISTTGLLENINRNFLVRGYLPFTMTFLAALVWSVSNLAKNKYCGYLKGMVIFNLVWFALELHKLPMDYLPVRYLISLYFSMGLLISIIGSNIFFAQNKRFLKYIAALLIAGLVFINSYHYFRSLDNRQYSIAEINEYVAAQTNPEDVLIGTWATSSNWQSKNLAIPVWHQFMETEDPIRKYNARVVVSEPDERESDYAYKNRGIDLTDLADSTRQFKLAYWNINFHWITDKDY